MLGVNHSKTMNHFLHRTDGGEEQSVDLVFSQLVEVRRDLSEQKCKCVFSPDLKMSPEPASRMHGANCSSERG